MKRQLSFFCFQKLKHQRNQSKSQNVIVLSHWSIMGYTSSHFWSVGICMVGIIFNITFISSCLSSNTKFYTESVSPFSLIPRLINRSWCSWRKQKCVSELRSFSGGYMKYLSIGTTLNIIFSWKWLFLNFEIQALNLLTQNCD